MLAPSEFCQPRPVAASNKFENVHISQQMNPLVTFGSPNKSVILTGANGQAIHGKQLRLP